MRSSTVVGACCAACLALTAVAVALLREGDSVDVRAKVLVAIYGSRCTVTDALISDGSIVAVCGEGHLQPFYGFMPCTEPPILCKAGVWPICYEPGPTLAIPAGRPRGKLGSLLP